MGEWSGPPWLLIVATALAFVVLPIVPAGEKTAPDPVELSSSEQASVAAGTTPDLTRTRLAGQPLERKRYRIGVVSFNQFRKLTHRESLADAKALGRRSKVDVIAWQEAYDTGAAHSALRDRGWRTRRFPKSARELAVSWRHSDWTFVSAVSAHVAEGINGEVARYPFPDRFAVRVTLRHRDSGELLSVINTHLPQKIENLDRPGRWTETFNATRARRHLARLKKLWDKAPGRWVVGAGDFNVDARAEGDVRPQDGLSRVMAGRGTSSFDELGFRGLSGPTHPASGRYIDYVFVSRKAVRRKHIAVVKHRVLRGLNSDHRPLLARIELT